MGLPLLINFDPPRSKEAYAKRVKAALGGGGSAGEGGDTRVVLNIVTAAEAHHLQTVGPGVLNEMPIDLLHSLARNFISRWT